MKCIVGCIGDSVESLEIFKEKLDVSGGMLAKCWLGVDCESQGEGLLSLPIRTKIDL